MVALRETDRLTLRDLPAEFRSDPVTVATLAYSPAPTTAVVAAAPSSGDGAGHDMPDMQKLNPLESAERSALLQELARHDWNLSSVARELGIARNTLYRKLQRLNIRLSEKSACH